MLRCFTKEQRTRLASARVGIAGAGGLGSNAAMMLARCGVGTLILADGDTVEPSNLNRQHYRPCHLGQPKVEALAEQLRELRPDLALEAHRLWLDEGNIGPMLDKADFWLEALDDAPLKALFVSLALRAGKNVFAASGMGGFGGLCMERRIQHTSRGLLVTVGDFRSDVSQAPPLAPRVIQCAAMQADAALEFILTGKVEPLL